MADKTYKMQVTLTDNRVIDAGTFVAPQGPQGPKGPQGPAGSSAESPILANISCTLDAGNITITIGAGQLYWNKRSGSGMLTDGAGGGQTITFDEQEYNIFMSAPVGTMISIDDEEGQLAYVATTTNQTLIKKTPSLGDGAFYVKIKAEYKII